MQKQWTYTLSKPVDQQIASALVKSINELLTSWQSHGKELKAGATLFEGQLLVVSLDNESIPASGCSVDSLNRDVIELINSKNLELAGRNTIPLFNKNGIQFVKRAEIKNLYDQGHITDDHKLIDLNHPFEPSAGFDQFLVPVMNSWVKNYMLLP